VRDEAKSYVATINAALHLQEPIYEFGSYQVPGQEGYADLRALFPGRRYVGCDMHSGPGVDLVIDVMRLEIPPGSIGTAIIVDTLEHVEYCREAVNEIHRVLKPNGVLIMTSVMNFPIHDFPCDYWRFTPECFRSLLKHFRWSQVDYLGDPLFPHTVAGVAVKDEVPDQELVKMEIDAWRKHFTPRSRGPVKKLLRFVLPPVIFELIRPFYSAWRRARQLVSGFFENSHSR
jgi:SAM-dependent methyltransferase